MNTIIVKEKIKVENLIYEIRGKQVMLDSDLAKLYQCKNGTKEINQAVKNNIEKFPERFSWILNENDLKNLRSKILTSKENNYGGRRYAIRVFTEQGVAMLATILKSKVATQVSINIMDAFVAMRHYMSNGLINNAVQYKLLEHDKRINLLERTFNNFKEKNNHIFFEGQIYDAFSLLVDILNKSKEKIIIIDNYAGKELLDLLKDIDKRIMIISKNINDELIKKYNKQYTNIKFINNNSFHDRFIIIDKKELYHCGSSFKDLGKKCFCISKIEDKEYLNRILEETKKIN